MHGKTPHVCGLEDSVLRRPEPVFIPIKIPTAVFTEIENS